MLDKWIVSGYGIFLLLGAYFGWKAGSKISLLAGLLSGLLVILSFYSAMALKSRFLFLIGVSGVLSLTFLVRLLKTQKFMPAGGLLVVTAIFLVFCLLRYLKS